MNIEKPGAGTSIIVNIEGRYPVGNLQVQKRALTNRFRCSILATAVFSGMVAASILVPLFVPMFYAVVQRIREKVKGAPPDTATGTQAG